MVGKWGDVIPLFDGERDQKGRLIENWNSQPVGFNGVNGEDEWVALCHCGNDSTYSIQKINKLRKLKNRKTFNGQLGIKKKKFEYQEESII